ncbi:MAG: hypothetical protein O3B95_08370 [Chloroflexi bacterium]|nr:hypothetical protein [Chloroflexota bacterium]
MTEQADEPVLDLRRPSTFVQRTVITVYCDWTFPQQENISTQVVCSGSIRAERNTSVWANGTKTRQRLAYFGPIDSTTNVSSTQTTIFLRALAAPVASVVQQS